MEFLRARQIAKKNLLRGDRVDRTGRRLGRQHRWRGDTPPIPSTAFQEPRPTSRRGWGHTIAISVPEPPARLAQNPQDSPSSGSPPFTHPQAPRTNRLQLHV